MARSGGRKASAAQSGRPDHDDDHDDDDEHSQADRFGVQGPSGAALLEHALEATVVPVVGGG